MDKRRCNEDTGTEMSRKKEEVVRHRQTRESTDDDGKGARYTANVNGETAFLRNSKGTDLRY